ncbi:ABC transporter permease [Clostridium sp.]|uniref:ABC transporter permease n=1 Tax=Clostridium sp. TaxID=1506 RepID=UPI003F3EB4EF
MKSYRELAFRYLKKMKNQSKFIMIAIILSTTLIISMLSALLTFNNIQKENALKTVGNYNSRITNLNKDEIKILKENTFIDKVGTEIFIEQIGLTDLTMINLFSYDKTLMELKSKTIVNGDMPHNKNEIVLEEWVLDLLGENIEIGDTITLNVFGQKEDFKLVGLIISNSKNLVSERVATGIVNSETLSRFDPIENPSYNSYILIKDGLDIEKITKGITSEFNMIDKILDENTLLKNANWTIKNSDNLGVIASIGFICFIVIFSAIIVIHNAVGILVLERFKQLGVLRAIGTTKKQVMKILRMELLILAVISIPIGIILGLILLKGILLIMNNSFSGNFTLIVNPYIILFTIGIGLITVLISSRKPLIFASKIQPIEAINNYNNIQKENINKKSGLLSKYLSIEDKIAYKNMKRNKKKFRNTLISITLSITLFITFYSLINYGFKVFDFTNNRADFNSDLRISNEMIIGSEGNKNSSFVGEYGFTDDYYNALKNIDGVANVYKRNFRHVVSSFKYEKLTNEYLEIVLNNNEYPNSYNNGEYFFTTSSGFYGYSDKQIDECNKYLKDGSIDIDKMNSENGVLIIQDSLMIDSDSDKTKNIQISNLNIGDEIYLDFNLTSNTKGYEMELNNKSNIDNNLFKKVKVIGVLTKSPYDRSSPTGGLGIIATEETYIDLTGKNSTVGYDIELSSDKSMVSKEVENISRNTKNSVYTDFNEINKTQKQYYIQISILLYGISFIVFIIGLLNIGNTINTNILLKTKEFATLKSIGITNKQFKKMVLLESSYYGIVGSICGSIIGSTLSFGVYKACFELMKTFFINGSITEFAFKVPIIPIILATTITISACVISSIFPLKRLKKINIVASINLE